MKDRFIQSVLCIGILAVPFCLLDLLPFPSHNRHENFLEAQYSLDGMAVVNRQMSPYSQHDMSRTVKQFGVNLRVLIYNGETNEFDFYNLVPPESTEGFRKNLCERDERIIPFLVHALRTHNPKRFVPGSPPFQILFSEMDSVKTLCTNDPEACDTINWAPIVAFSSVPKDSTIFPSVKAFPAVSYVGCLADWYQLTHEEILDFKSPYCYFSLDSFPGGSWENLINQVFWRGSDFPMLEYMEDFAHLASGHKLIEGGNLTKTEAGKVLLEKWDQLTPRFRAVALSIQAEADAEKESNGKQQVPWIDCKIVNSPKAARNQNATVIPEGFHHLGNFVDEETMATYRYQVDFGGYGGTTWVGTLTKLAMPGLLFHHETPMKDWYYDKMKPWVHYVPIQWDLSDLREKYEWAEANPRKAQKISRAGTDFAMSVMSNEYRRDLYEKLYVKYGNEVVKAYQPPQGETIESIIKEYAADGIDVYRFSKKVMKETPNSCWEEVK